MAFPPNFDHAWDLTQPPDTQLANLLGQDIRNLKDDVMQRLSLLSGTLANRPTPEIVNATWGGAGFGLIYFATDTNQLFQWNGGAWVQLAFSSNLVASLNLTGQNAVIGATVLYGVGGVPAGIYRANLDLITTQVGTGGSCQASLIWNNGSGVVTEFTNTISATVLGAEAGFFSPLGVGGGAGAAIELYLGPGSNIAFQTFFNAVTGAFQYSIRSRIEYLG